MVKFMVTAVLTMLFLDLVVGFLVITNPRLYGNWLSRVDDAHYGDCDCTGEEP